MVGEGRCALCPRSSVGTIPRDCPSRAHRLVRSFQRPAASHSRFPLSRCPRGRSACTTRCFPSDSRLPRAGRRDPRNAPVVSTLVIQIHQPRATKSPSHRVRRRGEPCSGTSTRRRLKRACSALAKSADPHQPHCGESSRREKSPERSEGGGSRRGNRSAVRGQPGGRAPLREPPGGAPRGACAAAAQPNEAKATVRWRLTPREPKRSEGPAGRSSAFARAARRCAARRLAPPRRRPPNEAKATF